MLSCFKLPFVCLACVSLALLDISTRTVSIFRCRFSFSTRLFSGIFSGKLAEKVSFLCDKHTSYGQTIPTIPRRLAAAPHGLLNCYTAGRLSQYPGGRGARWWRALEPGSTRVKLTCGLPTGARLKAPFSCQENLWIGIFPMYFLEKLFSPIYPVFQKNFWKDQAGPMPPL